MCNDYRLTVDIDAIREDFAELKIKVRFAEGIPNLAPRADIKMTEIAPIVRASAERGAADLVQRRWSWPGPTGKPVFNFRSDGRSFGNSASGGRCLIPTDGFYEFTKPDDPKKKLKDKWLFTVPDHRLFCIAGIWRTDAKVGEAWTMLTTEPGPDIAPYHDRQVVLLRREDWGRWLDPAVSAHELLKPLPAGSLAVEQVG